VILTLEPAAAGVTAAVMGENLELRTLLGGSLLIVAMLVVEIGSRKRKAGYFSRGARNLPTFPPERPAEAVPTTVELGFVIDVEHQAAHPHSEPQALVGVRDTDFDATVDRDETRVGERPH
jgi:hypothetical protein